MKTLDLAKPNDHVAWKGTWGARHEQMALVSNFGQVEHFELSRKSTMSHLRLPLKGTCIWTNFCLAKAARLTDRSHQKALTMLN